MTGAFSAIACAPHTYEGERVMPEALSLPPALFVHSSHDVGGFVAGPLAVAVPVHLGGTVTIHAVFASRAGEVAEAVRRGKRTVSIWATSCYFTTDRRELRHGILAAVDLVPAGADPGARITSVTDEADLSPDLRRCRAALDAYLGDDRRPLMLDILAQVEERGLRAFDPLVPVVAGIRDHLAARFRKRSMALARVDSAVRAFRTPAGIS